MSVDCRLLGEGVVVQAVPRLSKKHGLSVVLPNEKSLYGQSLEGFISTFGRFEAALRQLFEEFGVTWRDVYSNSDVGEERLRLAEILSMNSNDIVLDVGCGRGFFTVAAAGHAKAVVGLDLMNGLGRVGWWKRFRGTMGEFNLNRKVIGVRASAADMPFKDEAFSVVACVHAMRNFSDVETIQKGFSEMKRVTKKAGHMFVVETLPTARNQAQEAHLRMFQCKVKYARGELPYLTEEQITALLQKAGLRRLECKVLDFNLSVAPPFFFLNTSTLPLAQRKEAEEEYNGAVEAIRRWGEASPPTLLVEVHVE